MVYSVSQVPTLLTLSAGAGVKVLHVRILPSQGIPTTVLAYPRLRLTLNARHAGYYRVRESSFQKVINDAKLQLRFQGPLCGKNVRNYSLRKN